MLTRVLTVSAGLMLASGGWAQETPTKFTVRIENITKPDTFKAADGTKWSLAFSPGVAVVHTEKGVIFTAGTKDRGNGLEAQSEDGDPSRLAASLKSGTGIKSVTVFKTPVGATAAGPITPGAAYEFSITGTPKDRLSITTMMGQSNDWFYAPSESG